MAAQAVQHPSLHRPFFPTHASALAAVVPFKRHVGKTASPETFDQITMTRPPEIGDVVVLHTFSLDRRVRPRGDMAPCPICSPDHEKYLEGGTLIWCEASQCIYAIGPQCAGSLWKDGRVDEAIAKFKAAEEVARAHKLLVSRMLSVPEMRDWIKVEFPLALAADALGRSFRQDAAFLWSPLTTVSRSGGVLEQAESYFDHQGEFRYRHTEIGRLVGRSFLREGGAISAKLAEIDRMIAPFDGGRDHDSRLALAADLSAVERRKGPATILEAYQALRLQAELLKAPLDFFSPGNMSLVLRWGAQHHSRLSVFKRVGGRVVAETADQAWEGDVSALRPTSPLPPQVR